MTSMSTGDEIDNDCDGIVDEEAVCYNAYGTVRRGKYEAGSKARP